MLDYLPPALPGSEEQINRATILEIREGNRDLVETRQEAEPLGCQPPRQGAQTMQPERNEVPEYAATDRPLSQSWPLTRFDHLIAPIVSVPEPGQFKVGVAGQPQNLAMPAAEQQVNSRFSPSDRAPAPGTVPVEPVPLAVTITPPESFPLNGQQAAAALPVQFDRPSPRVAAVMELVEPPEAIARPEFDDPMARMVTVSDLVEQTSRLEQLQRNALQTASQIGNLEERVATLEAQQFSPTAFLRGQVIFALAAAGGGNPPGRGVGSPVLMYQTQLQVLSSFSGKDLLRLGLASGNFGEQGFANLNSLNTNMALLSYQADLRNQIQLNSVEYRVAALDDRVVFVFQPFGFSLANVLTSNAPYADAGGGTISRFAALNPIFRIGNLTTGVGLNWLVMDELQVQIAYGTRNGNLPGQALFAADHSALGVQLLYKPAENLQAGLAYINAYARDGRLDTFTGSYNADVSGGFNQPATINAVGGSLQWQPWHNFTIAGWGGAMLTKALVSDSIALSTTYQLTLGLADPFGRRGDLLAVMLGQPPKLNIGLVERSDQGTSIHLEAFYRAQLNDNISLTPGFFYVTSPGHIPRNKDIYAATLRLTFNF